MQTFLPYPDFTETAKVLDNKRLGKQRSETLILLRGGWPKHPAAKMWQGHLYALGLYGLAICDEWVRRGYKDTCKEKISLEMERHKPTGMPPWLGDPNFHMSHKSNLVRKNPVWYAKYFDVAPGLPYVWP